MSLRGDSASGARIGLQRCAWATLVSDQMRVPGQATVAPVYEDYYPLPLVRDCNVTDNINVQTEYFDNIPAYVIQTIGDSTIVMDKAYINKDDEVHVFGAKKSKNGKGYIASAANPYGALFMQRDNIDTNGNSVVELAVYLKVQAGGGTNNSVTKQATPAIQLRTINFTAIKRLCDGQAVYSEVYMEDELTPEIIDEFFSLNTINQIFEEVTATVTGVTITPATATLATGGTQTFDVTVDGTGEPEQDVTMAVYGGSSTSTAVAGKVLTVGADETAETLMVVATSVADTTKSGTAVVTVSA